MSKEYITMKMRSNENNFKHETAIVDDNVTIGNNSKIWHGQHRQMLHKFKSRYVNLEYSHGIRQQNTNDFSEEIYYTCEKSV